MKPAGMRWRRALLGVVAATWLCCLLAAAAVLTADAPAFAELAAESTSSDALLLDRDGRPLQRLRIDNARRQAAWTPLAEFSPVLVRAVVDAEDRRYWQHFGIDPLAMGSVLQEALGGHALRGASTITMQLATLLATQGSGARHGRGLAPLRKLAQMRDALVLERHWTKAQVLEAYLNLVPLRGELAGVPAAALGLLGKGASDLDAADSAVLAALIRAPAASPPLLARRACRVQRDLDANADCADSQDIVAALPARPLHLPGVDEAPHLARRLLHTAGSRVRSTLDRDLQRFAAESLRNRLAELAGRNVADGAALVLDNATGQVLAYVGSSGDYSTASEVDGVTALRQPGSTLKPFLYATAIEHGWLDASSILFDRPFTMATPAGLYAPQDYEHDYKGPVSLRVALASSLNAPAVRTLDLVGVDRFLGELHALGLASLRKDPRDYGVGLALGDGETSLMELANAYRALANGGRWSPVSARLADAGHVEGQEAPRQVFSTGTAFIIGDILADPVARATTFGLDSALDAGMWAAVKTGTSKGMRDNWAIGFTSRYTVAVWVGNFSGAPMWDVSGVSGAAPLWHDLVEWLHASQVSRAPRPPADVHTRRVDFQPPIEAERAEWYLGTPAACADCGSPLHHVQLQPSAVTARLLAPSDGTVVAPDPDIPQGLQRIRVEAQGPAQACLELDGRRFGACGRLRQVLHLPPPGQHVIRLVAADGQALASSTITVRAMPRP